MGGLHGFWKKLLLEIEAKEKTPKEDIISPDIINFHENWFNKTVNIIFKRDFVLTEKKLDELKRIFQTNEFSLSIYNLETKGTALEILFKNVVFPKTEIPRREEGGKHC